VALLAGRAAAGPAPRVYAGWRVVLALLVVLSVAAGLGFYSLAVYLTALTGPDGPGFSVGTVSAASAVFFLMGGVLGVPVGGLLSRVDARVVISLGGLLSAAALLLLSRVEEVWQLYAAYALLGAGFAGCGMVPVTTVVTRWFQRRRAYALTVATSGLSVGGVLVTPISAAMVDRHGLPAVAPWLALAFLLGVVPVTLLLVRSRPPDPGPAAADRGTEAAPPPVRPADDGVLLADAARTRFFRALTAAQLLAMLAQVGALAHLFNLVAEREPRATATSALSLLAFASFAGRFLGGWLLGRMTQRGFALGLLLVQAVTLVALSVGDGPVLLLVASGVFGLTVGNLLMIHPLLLAGEFGVRDYARIYSRSNLVATLGAAGGPALVGWLHDAVGGYGGPLAGLAGVSLLAALLLARGTPR
jgi:MFS family permease